MRDLIDRQAAINAAIVATDSWDGRTSIGREKRIAIALMALPLEQPERIKGKWNTYYHGGVDFSYSCAYCGYGAPFDMKGGKVYQKRWNYCPNCGADMMEGENNG